MTPRWIVPAALAAALALPAMAAAQQIATTAPEATAWGPAPPFLPPGAKLAVLTGNPMAQGVFTLRLQMPANYEIPAHTHPTAELVTVIGGTLHLGHGDVLDRGHSQALKPGAFADIPANHTHFAFAGPEGAVVQIHGMGPFAITYVDPAKDPQRATTAKQ